MLGSDYPNDDQITGYPKIVQTIPNEATLNEAIREPNPGLVSIRSFDWIFVELPVCLIKVITKFAFTSLSMKKTLHILGIIIFTTLLVKPVGALADNGLPDSAEFGYGVRIDLSGGLVNTSIAAAGSMKLNWLALDFDWENLWPTVEAIPDLTNLGQAMYLAGQNNLSVMISITKPPKWAISSNGPDPEYTVKVVKYLARTYPGTLLAIELFPGANTAEGWGTTPDPIAYLNLLQTTTKALQSLNSAVVIVAGGFIPLPPEHQQGDIDDLVFLDALYNAGAISWMPIIGIRLNETTGDPMVSPTESDKRCVRHFEEVRQIMVKNQHREGLIWYTGFSWPSGKIIATDNIYRNTKEQTRWLNQSFQILEAQLFIGVAFFTQINPPGPRAVSADPVGLIRPDYSFHPALVNLGQLISPPADNTNMAVQNVLVKKIIQEVQFKPATRFHSSNQ